MHGRFAPSPTGALHLGNLRTAMLAWLFARSAGSRFVLRFEDLDPHAVRDEYYDRQRRDLERLGIDWDEELSQRDHLRRYEAALSELTATGAVFECFCSRREVREAIAAPHGPVRSGYPGTCRDLDDAERDERRNAGRSPSLRLRSPDAAVAFVDRLCGPTSAAVDDLVLRRSDGLPAYNLVVVVDDAHQGIAEVVRGDDLLEATTGHLVIGEHLGVAPPRHAHVPLVLGPNGDRLAKRDGAVTLDERLELGETAAAVRGLLAASLGLAQPGEQPSMDQLLRRFDPDLLPRAPWVLPL